MTLIFVLLGQLLRDDVINCTFELSSMQLLCRTGEGFGNSRNDDDKDLVCSCPTFHYPYFVTNCETTPDIT
jgi:hypothetical protein